MIQKDGGLTVYYDDDQEIYAGHAIEASFDVNGVLMNTDTPG